MTWQGVPGPEDLCSWPGCAAVNLVTSRRSDTSGVLCLRVGGFGGLGEGLRPQPLSLDFPKVTRSPHVWKVGWVGRWPPQGLGWGAKEGAERLSKQLGDWDRKGPSPHECGLPQTQCGRLQRGCSALLDPSFHGPKCPSLVATRLRAPRPASHCSSLACPHPHGPRSDKSHGSSLATLKRPSLFQSSSGKWG